MPTQNRKSQGITALWPVLATLAASLILPLSALGQDEGGGRLPPIETKPRPRVPIYDPGQPVQKKVLKNGLTILVQEQRTSEQVAGAVALRMGTLYEKEEDAGRTQVLMKSIIAGTERYAPVELALRLLAADATLQSGVGPDLGQITILTKRERVEQAIDLFADVLLHPSFPDTAVEGSRQRALNAAAMEKENPLKAAYSMFLSTMYRGSPLERPIAGTVPGIVDVRRRDMKPLHQRYFVGGNMVVCFVGNFDGKKVMRQLEKALAPVPKGEALQPMPGDPVPLASDTTLTAMRETMFACLVYGYPAPGYTHPDYAALKIIESYLASEDRSPIAFWLPQTGLAGSIGVMYSPYPKHSSMAVYLAATGSNLPAARDTVAAVLGRLRTVPIDEGEWTVQLARVQNGTFQKQNDPLSRARSMSQFEAAGIGYDFHRRFEEMLLQLNPEKVRATAERWFTHSCEATVTPMKSESKL